MTHAEAIAAIDLILSRAEGISMRRGWVVVMVREDELTAARAGLTLLGEHTKAPLVHEQWEAT